MNKRIAIIVGVLVITLGLFVALSQGLNMGGGIPAPVTSAVADAKALMDEGKYQDAVAILESAAVQNSQDSEVQFLLGLGYFNLGQFDKARQGFERAMALDPSRSGAVHHNLGALAYQMGDLETAVQEFQDALSTDPEDPDTHYQLGATYLAMAMPQGMVEDPNLVTQAEAEFKRALELAPERVEPKIGLGTIYRLQNRPDEAIAVLDPVVEGNPEMSEALFALGQAYAQRYDAGKDAADAARARDLLQRFLNTQPPELWADQAQQILALLPE